MFTTLFKALVAALQVALAFFSFRKKQNDEAQNAANCKNLEATIETISNGKQTENELDSLTPDQRREYARTGMWPDKH